MVTERLRVYRRGESAGAEAAEVAGAGLPQMLTSQLPETPMMTASKGRACGIPDTVKAPGTSSEIVSELERR